MPKLDHETLLLACIAAIGLAMLLQTLILLLIFVAMRKAAASLREEAENLRSPVMPVIPYHADATARLLPELLELHSRTPLLLRGSP